MQASIKVRARRFSTEPWERFPSANAEAFEGGRFLSVREENAGFGGFWWGGS